MNNPSNAVPESPFESQEIAPVAISATRRLYWSMRRELWESRYIYIAPLAGAALILFAFLIRLVHLPDGIRAASKMSQMQRQELIQQPYTFGALLIMAAAFIVGVFYSLEALHGERRDRSILFWKSLPVSDLMTVLSKASIPLLVLPLLSFAITVVTQWGMLLLSAAVLLANGVSVALLWRELSLFHMWLMLLYHLLAIHALWYAPIYGWLLLVSAWARRGAFLWATLPLLAIHVVEKTAFNTSHFAVMLQHRLIGQPQGVPFIGGSMTMDPLFLPIDSGLWIGLAVAAVCLVMAVRLRRHRSPI